MSEKAEPRCELVEGTQWVLVAPEGYFLQKSVCAWSDDGMQRTVVNFRIAKVEADK